jgi:hypothetical protein
MSAEQYRGTYVLST